MGLATAEQLGGPVEESDDKEFVPFDQRPKILTLADKLRVLFDASFPEVHSLRTTPVWAAGEVLEFGGQFNKYITARGLQKQEGVIFRHLLRLILLLKELSQLHPPEVTEVEWRNELGEISDRLVDCCREVDPASTDQALEEAKGEVD
jgi:hypothetical protein